ncbi:MAG: Enoyl-[acyl-carrier-protein] reductase [NADH] FabI [Chlamydiales bacterium]|nr:Enoyl-[acyl-carrier-protein] reductase [NADH] FabI [Chlamydiales bacterium]MCH9620486.1 Enoyl-[acyl-carrier-protein] reductase [NADH] FabI [Chlamydiales bacterium]MCH9623471.1 Enoyl-[acyl-carrier-protein] reductase [NADH] FabI [Chlamydiales bacterium]
MTLEIDLKGKRAFIAGIADDQGFGWAIAKSLAEAGCEILVGTWTPLLGIFTKAYESGKFDTSRKLSDGSLLTISKIYPLDAAFDKPEDVPEEVRENKRYKNAAGYTVSEVATAVEKDFGKIDFLVHSLANSPEIKNSLLETSRSGYLAAMSASSYSFISLLSHFGPLMNKGGATLSLTYLASERAVPGYGGGMSSAKAALESDTRMLAFEAGRKWGVRVNSISAGALPSRAARAIGFIDRMIDYTKKTAPIADAINAEQVGQSAAFLLSVLASAITGVTLYVDNGMHAMGVGSEMLEE